MSLRYIDFLNLLFWSVVVAVVLHGVAVWSRGLMREVVPSTAKAWGFTLVTGFLNPFLYYIVLLKAYDLLPAQEAGTLNYFWPVMLVLLSVPVLGQRPGIAGIAGILLGFGGLIVISTHGDPLSMKFSNGYGVLLAVGSALIWAVYWLSGMKDPRRDEVKLFTGFVTALVMLTITMLITGTFRTPSLYGLSGGIYLGIFEMGITFLLWMKALRLAPDTSRVSNLVFMSPFISLIFIHFIVGEPILTSTFAGLTLVVSGILIQQHGHRKKVDTRA